MSQQRTKRADLLTLSDRVKLWSRAFTLQALQRTQTGNVRLTLRQEESGEETILTVDTWEEITLAD